MEVIVPGGKRGYHDEAESLSFGAPPEKLFDSQDGPAIIQRSARQLAQFYEKR